MKCLALVSYAKERSNETLRGERVNVQSAIKGKYEKQKKRAENVQGLGSLTQQRFILSHQCVNF
jgi:hypothetical protein